MEIRGELRALATYFAEEGFFYWTGDWVKSSIGLNVVARRNSPTPDGNPTPVSLLAELHRISLYVPRTMIVKSRYSYGCPYLLIYPGARPCV
jgi:hypothetical protein